MFKSMPGDLDVHDVVRFYRYVDLGTKDVCWNWKASTVGLGYGRMYLKRGDFRVHRVSFYIHNGVIRDDLCVCHTCDNPLCVNPHHLWQGTYAENMTDRDEKGRTRRGERHDRSKLTADDVRDIRATYATGKVTQVKLADRFGVNNRCISSIVNRLTWKHI